MGELIDKKELLEALKQKGFTPAIVIRTIENMPYQARLAGGNEGNKGWTK